MIIPALPDSAANRFDGLCCGGCGATARPFGEAGLVARNGQFPRVAETAEALQYQMARLGLNVKI
ncbi:hypothetical protein ABZ349_30210, partial [Streptomyces niveus]|uniref:hypothetical protein n=1 Tax=Streptomyces niveus TaxID=193462 RepID=UPI0033E2CABB